MSVVFFGWDGRRVSFAAFGEAKLMSSDFDVEVFYDGGCPLCKREIALIRRIDRRRRIHFTDIAAADFRLADASISYDDLMSEIHGRLPDGQWIKGVEVFRRLYAPVGFGWFVAPTRLPGISHLLEVAYRLFARNRLRLTGRCTDACRVEALTPQATRK